MYVSPVIPLKQTTSQDNSATSKVKRYWVYTDSANTPHAYILTAQGLPLDGQTVDGNLIVRRRSVEYEAYTTKGHRWEVEVECTSAGGGSSTPGQTSSPLNDQPEISFQLSARQVPVWKAIQVDGPNSALNGREVPAQNTAEDPFDPPLYEEVPIIDYIIRYNSRYDISEIAGGFFQTVNKNPCRIFNLKFEKRDILLTGVSSQTKRGADGMLYYSITLGFRVDAANHHFQIVKNTGYEYVENGKKKAVTNDDGSLPRVPRNLNSSGGILTAGSSPIYFKYDTKKETTWPTSLGVPTTKPTVVTGSSLVTNW